MIELLLFGIFLVWAKLHAQSCPCDGSGEYMCVRHEFYGFQLNHFILFFVIGMMYPNKFWSFMALGVFWEILEFWLSQNPELILKYGGCLSRRQKEHRNPLYNYRVYTGERKYHNPIDEALGIEHPRWHTWHGSVAELIPNVLGFLAGSKFVGVL